MRSVRKGHQKHESICSSHLSAHTDAFPTAPCVWCFPFPIFSPLGRFGGPPDAHVVYICPPCAWETVMLVECATLPGHHVMRCHMAALNVSPHIPQGKSIATGATGGQCREKKAPAFSSGRWPAKGTNAAAPHGEGWDTAAPQARAADQSQPMSARPCRALLKSDAAHPPRPLLAPPALSCHPG